MYQDNGLSPKYAGRLYLAALIVPEAASALLAFFWPDILSVISGNLCLNVLFSETIFLLLVTLACGFAPGSLRDQLGLNSVRPATLLLCILLVIVMEPVIQLPNIWTSELFGNAVSDMTVGMETGPSWCLFLLMAIYGPLMEELLCRGFIYRNLRASGHIAGAVIVSALCFGILHGNINQASYAIVIGIYFAAVCEVTGSIWPSFFMHFLINGTSVAALVYEEQTGGSIDAASESLSDYLPCDEKMLYLVLGIAAIVAVILSIVIIRGIARLEAGRNLSAKAVVPREERCAVLTPTMVIALLIGILIIVAVTYFTLPQVMDSFRFRSEFLPR